MTGTILWLSFSVIALFASGIFIVQEAKSCVKAVLELLHDLREIKEEEKYDQCIGG